MPRLPYLTMLLSLALAAGHAFAGPEEDQRARNALRVLTELQKIPEQTIPDKLLEEARAIVIIPDTLKVGFIIGGRRGQGLMSIKTPQNTWSQPVFVKLTGGSIGLQAGVQSSDVVLVFRNDRNLDNIVNGKFTLGADASVAAGPVGRNALAATDSELKAEIYSWSTARGLFAGIALDGAALQIDDSANLDVYGKGTTPRMIFEGRTAEPPSSDVIAFRDRLEEVTYTARNNRNKTSKPSAWHQHTSTPRAGTTVIVTPSAKATQEAMTTPIQSEATAAIPVQQGFQPVSKNDIHTEALDHH
ncbi:YSC84-related protein [Xylella fastidiosa subsp. pauca]|nr:YSC84-related protein [Xylella fastidiosa]ALR09918.2 ligand-binding protein SH3 [Xylella fastidiosa]WGZ32440.1 YSC84-related protein [Xylella fastidiosa subsp. pauca]WGZ34771.1 YSC84-related protein [Xylella fastidiosa subsp. pauca]WGZ37047.1 YSC84-related protein [Xylella fastidiosa subsp. pauca]